MRYTVDIVWDEEAKVWIATSKDIPGLILESESIDMLIERVKVAAPEILELNHLSRPTSIECITHNRQILYA